MKTNFYPHFIACAIILVAITGKFTAQAQQEGIYLYTDGLISDYNPHLIELPGNRSLMVKYSRFGWDSSWVSLSWLNNAGDITGYQVFKMTNPNNFLFDVEKVGASLIYSGVLPGFTGYPFIMRSDTSGNIQRVDLFYIPWNENIHHIIPRTNQLFTGYSSTPGVYAHNFRIQGNTADTVYTVSKIDGNGSYFRMFDVIDLGNGSDLMCGKILPPGAAGNSDNFIMKFSSTGNSIDFIKNYDFFGYDTEQFGGVVKLTNGNYFYHGQGHMLGATLIDGFAGVVDQNGDHIWSRQLTSLYYGIIPVSAIETASGNILLYGYTSTYQGVLIKFSSSGALIWKKLLPTTSGIWVPAFLKKLSNNKLVATGYMAGSSMLWFMNENGESCASQNDTTITITPATPAVANVPTFTITPYTAQITPGTHAARTLIPAKTDYCVGTGINASSSDYKVEIYPNPASEKLYIRNVSNYPGPILFSISDMSGKMIRDGKITYAGSEISIPLNDLESGMYLVHLITETGSLSRKIVVNRTLLSK